jgi:hypothetical protein
METELTIDEMYDDYFSIWGRLNPVIITEIDAKKELLNYVILRLQPAIMVTGIESPSWLYNLLNENKTASIIIQTDILRKRKNYIDILEGAVCSSPDSMQLWKVNYTGKKSFEFKGRILICTQLTRQEISKNGNLHYINRDCSKI